ncbi:unnamed protein product [Adineta steineri]|uniref:Uncharacterized protein n=1 Tax=Adineta steineri TaxID=433720 RepID=A0A815HPZ2_9BILA|nr:unnamed protein product [Adineta steineri]CAF1357935.1 unnamed protein product [Adineta steineri]CAF3831163.1 unnamed protein product [Adineta steineri]CAF3949837.1 unnamed protein product [Adineta steineri]
MSSNASTSGIESDTDCSLSPNEYKDNQLLVNTNNESMDTLIDDDDEGFINSNFEEKKLNMMSDTMKQCKRNLNNEQLIPITSKLIHKKSNYPSKTTQNPYDDDESSSSVIEDWDEECKIIEPYYFPSYIRRAQWPNHWRWTPPLGIRRTCTQQLHRNLGFEPSGIYDDNDNLSSSYINRRHYKIDFL